MVRNEIWASDLQEALDWLNAYQPDYGEFMSYSVFYSWEKHSFWERMP